MIFLDLVFWICDHWEEVTLNGILLLLLRKFIMSEVHKLIYFNRDEEMKWMRGKLEELTGEKWSGQQPIWKRAETRYIKTYYLLLRKELKRQRRVSKMKAYLKKLGKTKFQALLFSLIVNIVSAALFMTGTLDIDSVLNMWIPVINMTIGTVSTWVYIIVEGSIDKASIQNTGNAIGAAPSTPNDQNYSH